MTYSLKLSSILTERESSCFSSQNTELFTVKSTTESQLQKVNYSRRHDNISVLVNTNN